MRHIECLVALLALLFQSIEIRVVYFWSHCVANGVVAGDFIATIEITHEEVLADEAQIFVVVSPTGHILAIHALKHDRLGSTVDILALLAHNLALHGISLVFRLKDGDG